VRGSGPSGWSLEVPGGSGTTGKGGSSLGCLWEPRGVSIWSPSFRQLVQKMGHASPQVDQAGHGNGSGVEYTTSRCGSRGFGPPLAALSDRRFHTRHPCCRLARTATARPATACGVDSRFMEPFALLLETGHALLGGQSIGRLQHRLHVVFQQFGQVAHDVLGLVVAAASIHRQAQSSWGSSVSGFPSVRASGKRAIQHVLAPSGWCFLP